METKNTEYPSAFRLFSIVIIATFISEMAVMLVLPFIEARIPVFMKALIDSLLLIILLAPLMYMFFYRQLVMHMSMRKRAEAKTNMLTEELKRSNQELLQFASVAAHDLQSPLISMGSALQLLRRRLKGTLDPEADGFITHTQEMAADMKELIRNLLDYSRIDRHGTKFEPIDCDAILKKTVENLKVDIEDCGAEITHDPLPEVLGNSTLMVQLFQNIIANAIKFRGDQPPRVHIAVEQRERDYLFSFRDSGIGFDNKYAGRIFEVFQRLHEKGDYPGAGIGLATCKKIVVTHGGRIWVESEPGEGSTFFFTIPSE